MKNLNLQQRVLLLGMLPGVVLSLVLVSYISVNRFDDLDKLLEERTLVHARNLARAAAKDGLLKDQEILSQLVSLTLEESDVRAVSIFDADSPVAMVHAGPRMSDKEIGRATGSFSSLIETSNSIRVRVPIFQLNLKPLHVSAYNSVDEDSVPAKILGWAEVELSKASTQLRQYRSLVAYLFISIIGLITCLYISFKVSNRVAHPILEILKAINDIKEGRYQTRVRVEGEGDLNSMATGINSLAADLQRKKKQERIEFEEATRDLQVSMDELEIRNRELQIEQKEARAAHKTQSEFLANVSHEIRTPLSSIIGYISLLERSKLDDNQRHYLNVIKNSSDHLYGMINDLLDIHRLDAGRLILAHEPMNLRDVIEEVLVSLAPSAFKKNVDMQYHINDQVPEHVLGDQQRLRQILTNLIGNAVKFTEQGYIQLNVELISLHETQASIQLLVKDTGIGMTEDTIRKLFKAFSQADNSTARRYGGSGLGLRISRSLVTAMNGDIGVQSEPGKGSTFRFHITLDLSPQPEKSLAEFKQLQFLVMDDDHIEKDRETIRLLKRWNIQLVHFNDVEAAFESLAEADAQIDGILLGLQAHSMDFKTTADLLASLQPFQIPVIAEINSMDDSARAQLMELGASIVITRPTTQDRLHSQISKLFTEEAEEQKLAIQSDNIAHRAPPLILAVDDNEANLMLVLTFLEDMGLRVLGAKCGEEAVDIARKNRVDLIFMDIQMPGMNGQEAMEAIRAIPGKAKIPIIALTAHALANEKKQLLNAGMNDYQTKPINIEKLAECIRHWTGYVVTEPIAPVVEDPQSGRDVTNLGQIPFDPDMALRRVNQKPGLATEMMHMLLVNLPDELIQIIDLWEEERLDSLYDLIHKIHGGTRYCGVPHLQSALEHAETALLNNSKELPVHIRRVVEESQCLLDWVNENNWSAELERMSLA